MEDGGRGIGGGWWREIGMSGGWRERVRAHERPRVTNVLNYCQHALTCQHIFGFFFASMC